MDTVPVYVQPIIDVFEIPVDVRPMGGVRLQGVPLSSRMLRLRLLHPIVGCPENRRTRHRCLQSGQE